MNNKYFFPIIFLVGVLSIIFLCAIYLCSCPGTAYAEDAQPRVLIDNNPYDDEPVEEAEAPPETRYMLNMPRGWVVGFTNGADIRARGPAGSDVWIRLTPDRRRVIWVLNYLARTAEGQIVQRTRLGEAQLTERVAEPQVSVMEPAGCPSLGECDATYSVSVNWPFADPNALQAVEVQLNLLTEAIQVDAARLEAEAAEQANE